MTCARLKKYRLLNFQLRRFTFIPTSCGLFVASAGANPFHLYFVYVIVKMAKKSTKGTKKMSSKKAANAHYLQQTEESVRNHTASQKKHKEVYDEYKHEYSEESAHSMAKTPVFRSTKNHQQDLVNAGRQMGIQVNVRHYGPNAGAKRPVSVKSTKGHKQKSNVEPLTVNVSQGSSMPTPTRGNTVTRPFQLSSPRIKVSTTSESEHSPSPKSPMRDSKTIIYKSAEHGGMFSFINHC